MLQLGHIAGADDQAHQTNQIGQGIAEAQMVKRLRQLIAGQAEMAQGVARAHQHRGGGHGACQHTGGEPDIPAEHFTQRHGDQHRAADHHQRQHQVVFPVAEKIEKVGPGFYANAKINSIKPRLRASVLIAKCCWPNNRETTKTPMELPSCTEPRRSFPVHSPNASTTNNNRM